MQNGVKGEDIMAVQTSGYMRNLNVFGWLVSFSVHNQISMNNNGDGEIKSNVIMRGQES